jgi:hypothetical protein
MRLLRKGPKNMTADFIEYVPIMETHNAGDRVFIKSMLDAEGIVYYIQNETVAPYLFNALPMRIMVRRGQAAQARELLKDIQLSYSYGIRNWPTEEDDSKGSE